MKNHKILSYLLLAALTLGLAASCVKDREPAFDKKPTVRMQEALKECQDVLVAAPNGWAMYQFMNEENTSPRSAASCILPCQFENISS